MRGALGASGSEYVDDIDDAASVAVSRVLERVHEGGTVPCSLAEYEVVIGVRAKGTRLESYNLGET